jgi:hypothetical protein
MNSLTSNALSYVSTLSNEVLFPIQYFSYTDQGVALFLLSIKHIFELGFISYPTN